MYEVCAVWDRFVSESLAEWESTEYEVLAGWDRFMSAVLAEWDTDSPVYEVFSVWDKLNSAGVIQTRISLAETDEYMISDQGQQSRENKTAATFAARSDQAVADHCQTVAPATHAVDCSWVQLILHCTVCTPHLPTRVYNCSHLPPGASPATVLQPPACLKTLPPRP
jgi:hypothetical protein